MTTEQEPQYCFFECVKCGLSRHFSVKNPCTNNPPFWHCGLCGNLYKPPRKSRAKKQLTVKTRKTTT